MFGTFSTSFAAAVPDDLDGFLMVNRVSRYIRDPSFQTSHDSVLVWFQVHSRRVITRPIRYVRRISVVPTIRWGTTIHHTPSSEGVTLLPAEETLSDKLSTVND